MDNKPLETLEVRLILKVYKRPYCLKDLEEHLKLFNDIHHEGMTCTLAGYKQITLDK